MENPIKMDDLGVPLKIYVIGVTGATGVTGVTVSGGHCLRPQ